MKSRSARIDMDEETGGKDLAVVSQPQVSRRSRYQGTHTYTHACARLEMPTLSILYYCGSLDRYAETAYLGSPHPIPAPHQGAAAADDNVSPTLGLGTDYPKAHTARLRD